MRGRIDFKRYRKLRGFVARTFLHVLFWDVLLNVPGLRRLRRPPLERWKRIARRYRALAVEMGGVLIKLGQFLSIRVDILPREILEELQGLQDEVPPEPFDRVIEQIEADFGRPVSDLFAEIEPVPVGAASLAQVHRARLVGSGGAVVVKILRPGIEKLVETDLAAVALALRLLRLWRRIRQRVNLPRLADEISVTTRRELDLAAEGRNAERFASDFQKDGRVYIPKVFWEASAARTLTLENVGYLKIGDLAGLERAGIRRSEVARVLYRVYMKQIFEHHFVHADPHPGNLFLKPLPVEGEAPFQPGDAVLPPPGGGDRPFQVVFVDFGMVAVIPEHLRAALRSYAIGLGTRDAARVVQSYVDAGVLLPGADLRRLEEIHEALFQRFWGVSIGSLRDRALSEASYFLEEYRDLLYEIPFQVQVDLLFTSRAVGLLAGLSTHLDPELDPWSETLPFARRLATEELRGGWQDTLRETVVQGRALLGLPRRIESFLTRADRGSLTVQTNLAPETRRLVRKLERSIQRLSWMVIGAGLMLSGAILHAASPAEPYGRWLGIASAVALVYGLIVKR